MSPAPLDRAVRSARDEIEFAGVTWPQVLFLLGTGTGVLPERLDGRGSLPLASLTGVPESWRPAVLHHGSWNTDEGALGAWMLEDVTADAPPDPGDKPWAAAFPCWLASSARASILVHVAAGSALPASDLVPEPPEPLKAPSVAVVRDHLNLSGSTPLAGLGQSRLGPLFPDLTQLHHPGLRSVVLGKADELGIPGAEAVAACTVGPTLDTPAERRFLARAGAQISVQGLAAPLLAAAHSGLAVLSIVAVTDAGEGPVDLSAIVAASEALAPAIDDLLAATAGELCREARALAREIEVG